MIDLIRLHVTGQRGLTMFEEDAAEGLVLRARAEERVIALAKGIDADKRAVIGRQHGICGIGRAQGSGLNSLAGGGAQMRGQVAFLRQGHVKRCDIRRHFC